MSFFRSPGEPPPRPRRKPEPPPQPGGGGAKHNDPHTSKRAAGKVEAAKREAEVMAVVTARGAAGTISSDVHRATGIEMQTITPRWAPLRRKGMVKAKLDSDGFELARKGHLGHLQIIWYPTEPGDPVYARPMHALKKIKRLLPSLEDDEIEELFDIIRDMRNSD